MKRERLKLCGVLLFFLLSGIFYSCKYKTETFSMGKAAETATLGVPMEEPASAEELLGKLSLNHATAEELMELPGIGEKTAEKILKYRQEKGNFQDIREIMNVSGIGEKTFEKLKDSITVD